MNQLLPLISLALALAGFGYTLLRNRTQDTEHIEHRITVLETKLERVMLDISGSETRMSAAETKIDLFWRNLSLDAARILHSPDPAKARQDYLLEQFMADNLSAGELNELVEKLTRLYTEHDAMPGDRLAAGIVLRAVEVRYQLDLAIPDLH